MATFADWVNENVGSEDLRAKVTAVAVCLDDLKACELEDLEEELNLASWPGLAKKRFLKAWRALKAAPGPQPAALPPADAAAAPAGTPSPPQPADDGYSSSSSEDNDVESVGLQFVPAPPGPAPRNRAGEPATWDTQKGEWVDVEDDLMEPDEAPAAPVAAAAPAPAPGAPEAAAALPLAVEAMAQQNASPTAPDPLPAPGTPPPPEPAPEKPAVVTAAPAPAAAPVNPIGQCSICQDDLDSSAPALACGHRFHAACLAEMAGAVGTASSTSRRGTLTACPNCRTVSRVGTPTPFDVDDRVEARFKGRKWFYPGKITAVHVDGESITYDIKYDDGDVDCGLDARFVSRAWIDYDVDDDDDDAQRTEAIQRSLADAQPSPATRPAANAPVDAPPPSRFKYVYPPRKARRSWTTRLTIDSSSTSAGCHATQETAARAVDALLLAYGKPAVNFPGEEAATRAAFPNVGGDRVRSKPVPTPPQPQPEDEEEDDDDDDRDETSAGKDEAQRKPPMSKAEYDSLVLAAAQPQTSRHQRSQAARRQSFSSLVDTGKSYGEAPADDAPPSSLKRDIHRSGGQKRSSSASSAAPRAKKQKSNKPAEVVQRMREGKTSSRFHGVSWSDTGLGGKGGWATKFYAGDLYVTVGAYAEETEAALAYNQAVKDAGLEHKMNPVDANGQPIPKPGY